MSSGIVLVVHANYNQVYPFSWYNISVSNASVIQLWRWR